MRFSQENCLQDVPRDKQWKLKILIFCFLPNSLPPAHPRMETLDEFDNEYPLNISFCERISPLDFERESFNYTQKSLQDLYIRMDQNPEICERVVRKRMQVENEEAGLMQYLKVRL